MLMCTYTNLDGNFTHYEVSIKMLYVNVISRQNRNYHAGIMKTYHTSTDSILLRITPLNVNSIV